MTPHSSTARSDQAPDDKVLALEALLPATEAIHCLLVEALEGVEGAVEVLGEDVLVEAVEREAAAGVAAGEVLVRAAGAVEVAAARDVEHAAPHRQVHGHAVGPVVGEQGARREGPEDDGGRLARECRRRRRLRVQEVARVERDGDED